MNFRTTWVDIYNAATYTHTWDQYLSNPGTYTHNWNWATDETNIVVHCKTMYNFLSQWSGQYKMVANVHKGSGTDAYLSGGHMYFGTKDGYEWAKSSDIIYMLQTQYHIYTQYGNSFIGDGGYGTGQDDAMDRGIPFYFACVQNGESVFGEHVGKSINLSNTNTYNSGDNAWQNGEVIGGALWDLRSTVGVSLANDFVWYGMSRTEPTTFSGYLDAIIEYDDWYYGDETPSNGTPNIDGILTAFYNHEIYPATANIPPHKPLNLTAECTRSPQLQWDANPEPDLADYLIYRKVGGWNWEHIATTTNNYWTDPEVIDCTPNVEFQYYVKARDNSGSVSNASNTASFMGVMKPIAPDQAHNPTPDVYTLLEAHPNPFNPTTTLSFTLPHWSYVKLEIFDIIGNRVKSFGERTASPGTYSIVWKARDDNELLVPSGTYLYRVEARSLENNDVFTATKKMVLLR